MIGAYTFRDKTMVLIELKDLYKKGIENQANFQELMHNRIKEIDIELKAISSVIQSKTTPGGKYTPERKGFFKWLNLWPTPTNKRSRWKITQKERIQTYLKDATQQKTEVVFVTVVV